MMICGIDEAGRGPLAGPVCAASVILSESFDLSLLDDSKKMTEKRRDIAMHAILEGAVSWSIAWASAAEIDEINILQASLLAMKRSYEGMIQKLATHGTKTYLGDSRELLESHEVIVDGLYTPDIANAQCRAYPKADGTYPAVMAASILAKTARDRMMNRYSWLYPEYGYEKHKGYPTAAHVQALKENGPSPIQRISFRLKHEGQLRLF